MTDKTEMVLVSRDELQQLIGASVRCAFEEYRQEQAPQDTSEYYTIRQLAEKWGVSIATIWRHEKLGTHQRTADWTACPVPKGTDRPHQEPESHQQEGRQEHQGIIYKTHNKKRQGL
ncbi:MAG: hypothetical protein ACLUIE_10755 [Parabacteroides merdae]